ncbi:4a-hydroxytetrahydrobiopterin dehydratase [Candidatus Pacearchaeota archaeon]|nr:4a-hydroxytetrahydrobiopterin dehydratase [Candidatus Pacearchaeota archaeon]
MLSLHEINEKMKSLKDWDLDVNVLTKTFVFPENKQVQEFVNKVMQLSEELNHHPEIIINKNTVKLNLITKEENTLTKLDFQLAEAIDRIENVSN